MCSLAGMIKDRTAHYNNGCLYVGCTHKEPSLYLLFGTDGRRNEYILVRKNICLDDGRFVIGGGVPGG
jgi:hypothetical protein